MANPLDNNTHKGTLGELFVQLKLLTKNIESFFPLKDSGNDLIAFIGDSFKSIQVKTRKDGKNWSKVRDRKYDILALVDLDEDLSLDKSKIWLLTKQEVEEGKTEIRKGRADKRFLLSDDRIEELKKL